MVFCCFWYCWWFFLALKRDARARIFYFVKTSCENRWFCSISIVFTKVHLIHQLLSSFFVEDSWNSHKKTVPNMIVNDNKYLSPWIYKIQVAKQHNDNQDQWKQYFLCVYKWFSHKSHFYLIAAPAIYAQMPFFLSQYHFFCSM